MFLPYVTQELPRYSELSDSTSRHIGRMGEIQLGFIRQAGGHYVPIQIPGYISTTADDHPSQRTSLPPVQTVSYGLVFTSWKEAVLGRESSP